MENHHVQENFEESESETPSHGVDELIQLFDEIDESKKEFARKKKNLERIGKMESNNKAQIHYLIFFT